MYNDEIEIVNPQNILQFLDGNLGCHVKIPLGTPINCKGFNIAGTGLGGAFTFVIDDVAGADADGPASDCPVVDIFDDGIGKVNPTLSVKYFYIFPFLRERTRAKKCAKERAEMQP